MAKAVKKKISSSKTKKVSKKVIVAQKAKKVLPKVAIKKKTPTSSVLKQPSVKTEVVISMPDTGIKRSWSELPTQFPPQVKFILRMAEKELETVAQYPFPFAKFIYSLPKEVCGMEFALLLLSLEHNEEAIGKLCKMDREGVVKAIESGKLSLGNKFSDMCGEIERKWRAGSARSLESVAEPYLISNVDRNFQLLVSSVVLKSMGCQNTTV